MTPSIHRSLDPQPGESSRAGGDAKRSPDVLFLSYFEDIDRWHNDVTFSAARATGSPASFDSGQGSEGKSILARSAEQAVTVDGHSYDVSRFLSIAGHGNTGQYRRFDPFSFSHLSGKYYESLGARHGFDVEHVNHVTRIDVQRLGETVAPRWVMLSSTFMTEPAHLLDAMQHIRRAFPDVPVAVGGLFLVEVEKSVSAVDFQRLLLSLRADVYVISPLGEAAFLGLLESDGDDLASRTLPGCWVRDGRRFQKSDAPEPGLDIDENWVRWDELAQDDVYHVAHTRTARSCAFKCSFCSYPANQGALTLSEPDTLRRELESIKRGGRVKSIIFTDDTFNVPMPRYMKLLDVLAEFDIDWYSYFRCQFATEDVMKKMVDAGCRGVFLGFESIDDRVLKNMHKAVNYKAYARGAELVAKSGIMAHANFIIGFPGDRPENAQKAIDFVDEFEIDTYYMTPWFCSPATPISNERERFGIEGNYYRWKHDTMTSDEAMEIERWAIGRAKSSVWAGDLSGRSFWTCTLLMANGMSRDEFKRTMRVYANHVGRDLRRAELEADPEFQWLRGRLQSSPFPEPPRHGLLHGDAHSVTRPTQGTA